MIVFLNKVGLSKDIDKDEEIEEIKRQHQRMRTNMVFSSLLQDLRKQIKIDFNNNLIQSLDIPVA